MPWEAAAGWEWGTPWRSMLALSSHRQWCSQQALWGQFEPAGTPTSSNCHLDSSPGLGGPSLPPPPEEQVFLRVLSQWWKHFHWIQTTEEMRENTVGKGPRGTGSPSTSCSLNSAGPQPVSELKQLVRMKQGRRETVHKSVQAPLGLWWCHPKPGMLLLVTSPLNLRGKQRPGTAHCCCCLLQICTHTGQCNGTCSHTWVRGQQWWRGGNNGTGSDVWLGSHQWLTPASIL